MTGLQYSNNVVELSAAQPAKLPTIVFRLESASGNNSSVSSSEAVEIEVAPSAYMERFMGGRYAARVYLLTEQHQAGAVLGANFMSGYNVIFHIDHLRVGFARSDCTYMQQQQSQLQEHTSASSCCWDDRRWPRQQKRDFCGRAQ